MSPEQLLVAVPAILVAGTLLAVPAARRLGRAAGYPLAVFPVAAAVALLALLREVLAGPVEVTVAWVPQLGASWQLHLDALGLVFALIVTLVGAVVLAYSAGYLGDEHPPARYYAALSGFGAAMTVLLLAGDALVLYVGWEGTTLASFLLIGTTEAGRRAATRALMITFMGGLALLAGLLLASASLDSLALADLTRPRSWTGGPPTAFLALLVVAAAAKSAQVPFHVWLPGAMVAPTPVSAYLHAAAMVTAGVYLLLRFAAVIAADPVVAGVVAVLGTVTAVFAATAALRRDDLKELLAYSTISQLGFMLALVGVGTTAAVAGSILHVLAHGTYKGALFLAAGVYDHALGGRTLGNIAGSARRLPVLAGAVVLASASMAGVVPALGWASKEEALEGLLEDPTGLHVAVTVGLAAALALTVAYSLRVAVAPFRRRAEGPADTDEPHGQPVLTAGAAVLAVATVVTGVFAARLTPLVDAAAEAALGRAPTAPLGLWHGVTPAFLLAVAILVAGAAAYGLVRARGLPRGLPSDLGTAVADRLARATRRAGTVVLRPLALPTPAPHLAVLLLGATAVVVVALAGSGATGGPDAGTVPRWVVSLLLAAAAVVVARTRDRTAALAAMTGVSFLVATWYALHGAPQLAAVQLLVDGLTVALALFIFRRLPRDFPVIGRARRIGAVVVALAAGGLFGALSWSQASRVPSPASEAYLREVRASEGGNVVGAVLTEFRALDTLGEATVIAVAAIGVVTVLGHRKEPS